VTIDALAFARELNRQSGRVHTCLRDHLKKLHALALARSPWSPRRDASPTVAGGEAAGTRIASWSIMPRDHILTGGAVALAKAKGGNGRAMVAQLARYSTGSTCWECAKRPLFSARTCSPRAGGGTAG
jgi:hypothetical protein